MEELIEDLSHQNYIELKKIVDEGVEKAMAETNSHEAKGILIEVQQHFKGLKLRYESREELYSKLQEAFSIVNKKIEEEKFEFELETLSNYEELKPMVSEAVGSPNADQVEKAEARTPGRAAEAGSGCLHPVET